MIGSDPLGLHLADPTSFGLIPNALISIMDRAAAAWDTTPKAREARRVAGGEFEDGDDGLLRSVSLRLSVLEVYNDRLRDLMSPNRDVQPLKVREDPVNGPYAVGLQRVDIDLATDKADRDDKVLQLLSVASAIRVTADNTHPDAGAVKGKGGKRRQEGGFFGHEASSRGHAILNVDLEVNGVTTRAQLVDLAGSERAANPAASLPSAGSGPLGKRGRRDGPLASPLGSGDSKVQQQRHRERVEIGRSLSNLNVIINGLSKGDDPASLPFRECKMTWLLKQVSLGSRELHSPPSSRPSN